jgi:hypothetical protein
MRVPISNTVICVILVPLPHFSQAQQPTYQAKVPDGVTTPDVVQTRQLGTLSFKDGVPSAETVQKVYDNLDFYRGIETFLVGIPAASMHGYLEGMKQTGMDTFSLGLYEDMLDARSLWLTPNTTTLYGIAEINVREGPTVLEVPPGVLGPVMDAYFRFVADVGFTGADQGKGGKYLFVPPGYEGALPKHGYYIVHTPTYRNGLLMRAFVIDRDIPKTVRPREEALASLPVCGGEKAAKAALRQPDWQAVQHDSRQQPRILRRAQRFGPI